MNITHDSETKKATLAITPEELNNIVISYLTQKIKPLMVDAVEKVIFHRTQGDISRCQEATGMTFENLVKASLLEEQVMAPAIKTLLSASIPSAVEQAANRYVNTLIMVQRNNVYDRTFNDSLLNRKNNDENADKIFAFNRARHTTFMIDVLDECISHEMQKSGATHEELMSRDAREAFCKKTYGHRLSSMTNPCKRSYILVHASEAAMVYNQCHIPINPRAVMALTLNLRKDPYIKADADRVKKGHSTQIALVQYIAESARDNMPDHKVESLCRELFGCTLVEAFDPSSPHYIMSMCKSGNNKERHPSQATSFEELLSMTIRKHARQGANLNLLKKLQK